MEVFERYRLVDIINMQCREEIWHGFVPINIGQSKD